MGLIDLLLLLTCLASCSSQSDTLTYEVWEERHPGTLVGNLTKDAGLEQRWSLDQIREMTYRTISQQSSRLAEYFTVDESLGVIRTTRIIDRDRLCSQNPTCDVSLTIRIDPIKYFEIIKVRITINDRNDNPPTFSSPQEDRVIQESASPGTRITIPNAEDLDSAENGIKSYELQPLGSPFSLDTSDFENADSLSLVLKERLDRETQDFYELTVIAHDGGASPLSGSIVVRITVLDTNDNNPRFSNQTYEVSLFEDTPPSTTIVQVHASDPDKGLNGEVVYSLEPATETEFGEIFGIGNHSGDVFLKGSLDYEQRNSYVLSVLARDRGPNSLPAYARVVVNVKDINDNAPVIQMNTLNENGIATVAEGANVGLFVAHLSIKDEDTTFNKINCTLDSIHFSLTQLFETEYKLVTKTVFDREEQSEYHVNLVCQDSGMPPKTTTKYIPIIITDINDNAPTFYQTSYNVSVKENAPIGTSLIRFNASDKDIGENAAILYKVRNNDTKWVDIDLVSGVVVTSALLDYESQSTIEIIVFATDQGKPELSTSATLVVNIIDVIDDVPKFSQDSFSFSLEENSKPMTRVGLVSAKYNRNDVAFDIVYNLVSDNPVPFIIKDATIFSSGELDRENQTGYRFQITANNAYDATLKSIANITVKINDVNDNAPQVLYPNVSNNYIKISSKTAENSVLVKIQASDADDGVNKALLYRISDSSCQKDLFGIDDESGVIYLVSTFNDSSEPLTCEVHVRVEDKGTPKKATTVIIIFFITDDIPFIPGLPYSTTTTEQPTVNETNPFLAVESHQDQPFWKTSTMFGVGVAIAVFVIMVVVLIAVVVIKHRRKAAADSRRYNCRIQAEKVLKTPSPIEKSDSTISDKGVLYGSDNTMTLDIDVGESNTDDFSEWHSNVNPDIIRVTKGRGVTPSPSPNTSSAGSSRIQDSGLDLSWQDTSGFPPVWSVPLKDNPKTFLADPGLRKKHIGGSPLSDVELQVQDMLHMMEKDRGSDTGSFTDSGKGPSEEGDQNGHLPPLEPRFTPVKQASKSDIPLVAEAHQMALKVMDDYCKPSMCMGGKSSRENGQIRECFDPRRNTFKQNVPCHVRRHHSDNVPVRTDKDGHRRRSYSNEHRTRDPALYDIYDIPLQSSPSADIDTTLSHDNSRLLPSYLTSQLNCPQGGVKSHSSDLLQGSEHELGILLKGKFDRLPPHSKHTTSGVLLRSPKRDKYAQQKVTAAPLRGKSKTPSYTVGPVDVCVKDVISQYMPKRKHSADDSCGAMSDGTTTSGSYTVNSELPSIKESWGSDSIIV